MFTHIEACQPTEGASMLAVVGAHKGELYPRILRAIHTACPIQGVDMVDGFQGVTERFAHGIHPEGNITFQCGYRAVRGQERRSTVQEHAARMALCFSRLRAAELLRKALHYRHVADIHGCENYYDTMVWIGQEPTRGVIALLQGIGNPRAVVAQPESLAGRLRYGSMLEVRDGDPRGQKYIPQLLGAIATESLVLPPLNAMSDFQLFKLMPSLMLSDIEALGIKDCAFEAWERLDKTYPQIAAHYNCPTPLYTLSYDPSYSIEVVTEVPHDYIHPQDVPSLHEESCFPSRDRRAPNIEILYTCP